MVLSMVLTICCIRIIVGLVVAKGVGCSEALLLDHLDEGTNSLAIIDGTDVEVGMKGWTYHL